jgi:hypothetical protein
MSVNSQKGWRVVSEGDRYLWIMPYFFSMMSITILKVYFLYKPQRKGLNLSHVSSLIRVVGLSCLSSAPLEYDLSRKSMIRVSFTRT